MSNLKISVEYKKFLKDDKKAHNMRNKMREPFFDKFIW